MYSGLRALLQLISIFVFVCFSDVAAQEKQSKKDISSKDALKIGRAICRHEIDNIQLKSKECFSNEIDRIGSENCALEAREQYETVMNVVYQALLVTNKPMNFAQPENNAETKEKIKSAQQKWLTFDDAEQDAESGYYDGTGTPLVLLENDINRIKGRIAELMLYFGACGG